MLQKLSDHVAACLQRAEAAESRAADVSNPAAKQDFEDVAQAWRNLASSYQFSETIERFILDAERARHQVRTPPTAPQ